ncbi:carboxypeptidase N subunit 2-like [Zophobas morio]|uniref:carboxypeptidase N subunit 2-like n=1 Tax=Zophobas morio TaxID=2755281 RepID=UPI0030827652
MCTSNLHKLIFLVYVLFSGEIKCGCRHSYLTFCDDLTDLNRHNVENWTELVVGKEDGDISQLHSVDYDTFSFDKFERLTTLIVVRQIKDIKTYTFTAEPEETKLEYLKLYGNVIKRLRFTTFDNLMLRKLSLVNNEIEYIHKEAFYNCEIRVIDLSQNKLEMIEAGVFTEDFLGNFTKELIFRNNKIETIEANSLPSSLEILNLDYNNIKNLNYNVFENLRHLQEFSISYNKIQSLPGVKQFGEIRVIDASHNRIVGINAAEFNELTQLEVLDLSHNRISYPLTFNKFNFPERHPSLQISLAFNKLTHLILEDDSFRHHIVILYGNPWDCKCWAIMEKFMIDNKVKRNQCDMQYFGTGQVPYCINYACNDCTQSKVKHPNFTNTDIERFSELIKKTEGNVGCNLKPRRL